MRSSGRSLAVLVAGSLLLVGCSDGRLPESPPQAGPPTPVQSPTSRGVDVASYYEDYTSATGADSAGGPAQSSAGAPVGATPRRVEAANGEPTYPGLTDGNTFVDAGTSGFVETAVDPRSTFALDVDTGSWGVARTLLRAGILPPPESIRVEEWVNAQPVEPGTSTSDVEVRPDAAMAPTLDDGTQLVRVAVAARAAAERRPVNLTLVVDRSGSMDVRERLGLVQSSLAILADSLRDDDTVSVVSFEDEATPLLEPTPARDTETILAAIDRLSPGGSTNLESGLRLGYRQARKAFRDNATNLVVLASDGVANVGDTAPGSLVDEIRREGAAGIHLVTVGYGMGNYNDHLMEQLADLGDGFYAYVDDLDEAERLFREDLTATLVPVATEARVQVRFDPELVSSYRLVGYDNREIGDDDFTDDAVDAGELAAAQHSIALYEVRPVAGLDALTAIGTATVRWTPVDGGPAREATTDLLSAGGDQPTGSFGLDAVVADLAQLLKRAEPFGDRAVSLADLERRAGRLEDAGVEGAAEVRDLVRLARAAKPAPAPVDGPPRHR